MSEWQTVGGDSDKAFSQNWDFDTNKELIGVLINKKENVGQFGSTLLEIQTKDGVEHAVWANKQLRERFATIDVGDEVKIVYNGKVKVKSGIGSYRDYTVQVKKLEVNG